MNILIIEDEPYAAGQLKAVIKDCLTDVHFGPVIDNIEDAVGFLSGSHAVDLIFMDINLSDGLAFEIFGAVETFTPVIFTTAYDHYAIKAFDVNSIAYLLKPISKDQVEKALDKYKRHSLGQNLFGDKQGMLKLQELITKTTKIYKENFLIPYKDKLLPVPVKDFAWFEIKDGAVLGTKFDKRSFVLEERSVEELARQLDPEMFYRANRQFLIHKGAVREVSQYFNGKLLVSLVPAQMNPVTISREKASDFKNWMER